MDNRGGGVSGIQWEMENLLNIIGEAVPDEYEEDEEGASARGGNISTDNDGDYDEADSNDVSYLEKDAKSLVMPDLSIFGAEGQLLYQDIVDGDLTEHDDVLNTIFQQSKAAARLHLIQIKQRLISERDSALQTSERHNLRLLQIKNDEIEALQKQLASTESVRDRWIVRFDTLKNKIPPKITKPHLYFLAKFSVLKIFTNWKRLIAEQKKEIQLEKFAVIMKRRSMLSQTFAKINRENARSRMAKLKEDHKVIVDRITKEIVESYENELNRLRTDSVEAHTAARHEQLRRKQLEEDLRRMLLKNMTAMNFEALSLFQHTTVPTPLEQQQSMGELKDIISSTADISCIERENRGNTPGTARTISKSMSTAFTSNTNISLRQSEYDRPQHMEYEEETPRKSLPTPSMAPPQAHHQILPQVPSGEQRGITPTPTRPPLGTGVGTGMVRGIGAPVFTRSGPQPTPVSVRPKETLKRTTPSR